VTDLESFITAINESPADFELRAVFADWLEERGDETAAGWRWLNAEGRTPVNISTKWGWRRPYSRFPTDKEFILDDLPESDMALTHWRFYHTPYAALSAAAQAVIESGILNEAASIDKTFQNAHSA